MNPGTGTGNQRVTGGTGGRPAQVETGRTGKSFSGREALPGGRPRVTSHTLEHPPGTVRERDGSTISRVMQAVGLQSRAGWIAEAETGSSARVRRTNTAVEPWEAPIAVPDRVFGRWLLKSIATVPAESSPFPASGRNSPVRIRPRVRRNRTLRRYPLSPPSSFSLTAHPVGGTSKL